MAARPCIRVGSGCPSLSGLRGSARACAVSRMVSLLISTPITAAMSKVASTALITRTILAGAVIGMRLPNPIVVRLTKAKHFDCAKFKLHRLPVEPPSDYPVVLQYRHLLPGRSLTEAVLVTIKRASGLATSKGALMVPPAATPPSATLSTQSTLATRPRCSHQSLSQDASPRCPARPDKPPRQCSPTQPAGCRWQTTTVCPALAGSTPARGRPAPGSAAVPAASWR